MAAEPGASGTDETISVVIVEDHPLFRKGLRAQFDTDPAIEVVGEFGTAAEAVPAVLELRPSVVLMDLRLPWTPGARPTYCGAQAITQIRQHWPEVNIAVITTFDDDKERVHEAIKAGARSYVSKAGQPHALISVIRLTAEGITVLHPEAGEIVAGLIPLSAKGFTWFSELSARENEQLALAAAGATKEQIAEKLGISEKTVSNYWSNILQKLGVPTRREAIEMVRANGFRSDGESSFSSGDSG
jgi:DNA-binding NarL/FixJ family response regulator